MYSVVLATMLAAGSTTPAWHHNSCYGCYSCYAGYSGYSGYSCGCYGGCHRIFPIFHRGYCSGWGCSSYGCCSGYYGCYGGTVVYSTGCSICCGAPVYMPSCTGCCNGGVRVVPVPPVNEKVNPPKKKSAEEVAIPTNIARVTLNVPNDARVWIENVECPLTSTVRTFNTPALNPNQRYFYNIRAAIVRDGQTITETQRVLITPGQESLVDFTTQGAIATAAAR